MVKLLKEAGRGLLTSSSTRRDLSREQFLALIATGRPISGQTVVVTAHPDDEVIGMGGNMAHFQDLTVLQLTNGAPMDQNRIEEAGFVDRVAYADARRREVHNALAVCAPRLSRFACLELVDGGLINDISTIIKGLEAELVGTLAVFTHPFEGGHIDHDVAAFCVQTACRNLRTKGCEAPNRFEFASYHDNGGSLRTGDFWPDENCLEVTTQLSPAMLWRRETGFACHGSQRNNLRAFGFGGECFRVAPLYDFEKAAPPGPTLYGDQVSADLIAAVKAYSEVHATRSNVLVG